MSYIDRISEFSNEKSVRSVLRALKNELPFYSLIPLFKDDSCSIVSRRGKEILSDNKKMLEVKSILEEVEAKESSTGMDFDVIIP